MAARLALSHARPVSPLPSRPAFRSALRRRALALTLPLALATTALAACGDDSSGTGGGGGASGSTDAAATTSATTTASTTGPSTGTGGDGGGSGEGGAAFADRPYEVFAPSSYEEGTPIPLVILLHGYTASSLIQEGYMDIEPLAEELGFLYITPDGTEDEGGDQFWNATDACCNFYGSDVDDSGYLRHIVDATSGEYSVDPRRVHFIGHSNGGFMSYRMACDHADAIASIVSLAGGTFADPADCAPSEPVAVLQIHGTADTTIEYEGGTVLGSYPGAVETAETWAAYDGCGETSTPGDNRDLDVGIEGEESTTQAWDDGCDPGGLAELWTIPEGSHVPSLSDTFSRQAIEWLLDHPKP